MKKVSVFSCLLLTACVTINIYFPAAAAEKVADEIIQGIQADEGEVAKPESAVPPQSKMIKLQSKGSYKVAYQLIDSVINFIIPAAHAGANLSVNTPEISNLRGTMQARFGALSPFYSQGLIGIKADGFIMVRGAVPLKSRNKVNGLVAAENADRQRLYQAIANANGHPEWAGQIKSTFATRWVGNARAGWWYQSSNGSWAQK